MVNVIPLVQRQYTRIRAESFGGGRGGEEIKLVPYLVHFKRDPISIVYSSLCQLMAPMHRPPQLHHTSEQCKRLKEREKETKKI